MKINPSGYEAHLATKNTKLVVALRITRRDAVVFGWTSADRDITVDGVTYSAAQGLKATDLVITAGAAVGNIELTTLDDGSLFKESDILSGVWNNGVFVLYRYIWADISVGVETLLAGTTGNLERRRNIIVLELRDLRQFLQQTVGSASSIGCRATLGDAKCGVRLDPLVWVASTAYAVRPTGDAKKGSVVKPTTPNNCHFKCTTAGTSGGSEPTWNTTIGGTTADGGVVWTAIQALTVTATVTNVTSDQVFRDSARAEPADFFGEGRLQWLTGNNTGFEAKIKEYASDGTFTLVQPMYNAVQVGDTFESVAGCRGRREEDCRDKHDNVLNMVAEPDRKGVDALTESPVVDV